MVLVRRIDIEATALQRQGELGMWAGLLGQEAAQVGAGRALRPQDLAFPTYREHGVAWCRGVDPAELLGLFRGVDHGGWDPEEKGFSLYTIVIGSQTLHATGYAMGIQRDGATGEDGEAVIAFFGDGASSQGDVNEAFVWAAVYNAPWPHNPRPHNPRPSSRRCVRRCRGPPRIPSAWRYASCRREGGRGDPPRNSGRAGRSVARVVGSRPPRPGSGTTTGSRSPSPPRAAGRSRTPWC